ncbi:MAG: anhydro-N-acetylmuramic acid kinase [Nitrospinota bacterium]
MREPPGAPLLAIGLMSGTSADGVDAALVRIAGGKAALLDFRSLPHAQALRGRVLAAGGEPGAATAEICSLHREIGEAFARAALEIIAASGAAPSEVSFIGSHGQTVRHLPEGGVDLLPSTLQLGDAAVIAERTGITVVADFRARDVAAGGSGAPLAPWAHRFLFERPGAPVAFLNLGGIANLTYIPPAGRPGLFGFDCGPANMALDGCVARLTRGAERFDRGGRLAARGRVDKEALGLMLAHPFLRLAPPKSTGRETFGEAFLEGALAPLRERGAPPEDELATLTAFSAECVLRAARDHFPGDAPPAEFLVGGGGYQNETLLRRLREGLAPIPVRSSGERGIPPGAVEAVAFALLGWASLRGVPANVPAATGARREVVLGHITPGDRLPAFLRS